jgi:DNA-binding transcriptional MerR regulator
MYVHPEEPSVSDLFSIGGAASVLGCSPSWLRKLELLGVTEPAHRLAGSDRRVYSAAQVEALRKLLDQRSALPKSRRLVEAA